MPWIGTLANHAILALSGVVGRLVVVSLRASLSRLAEPQLAILVATFAAAFVFLAIDVAMTMVVVGLRENLTIPEASSTIVCEAAADAEIGRICARPARLELGNDPPDLDSLTPPGGRCEVLATERSAAVVE